MNSHYSAGAPILRCLCSQGYQHRRLLDSIMFVCPVHDRTGIVMCKVMYYFGKLWVVETKKELAIALAAQ